MTPQTYILTGLVNAIVYPMEQFAHKVQHPVGNQLITKGGAYPLYLFQYNLKNRKTSAYLTRSRHNIVHKIPSAENLLQRISQDIMMTLSSIPKNWFSLLHQIFIMMRYLRMKRNRLKRSLKLHLSKTLLKKTSLDQLEFKLMRMLMIFPQLIIPLQFSKMSL